MGHFGYRACLGLLTASLCLSAGASIPALSQTTATTAEATAADSGGVLAKVLSGRHILYLRHTETDSATKDVDFSDMSNCANQRILSAEGREHATKLGNAVKALNIPIGTVITSRFCRAIDTAKLMGFANTTVTVDLDNDSGEPLVAKDESTRRAAALRKLLAVAPEAGKNTLIVGHVPNMREAVGLDYAKMKEGEMAVFIPKQGDPGYEAVGRITSDELLNAAKVASK